MSHKLLSKLLWVSFFKLFFFSIKYVTEHGADTKTIESSMITTKIKY